MILSKGIRSKIEEKLGGIEKVEVVSGGNINRAVKIVVGDRQLFVKFNERVLPGMMVAEKAGLELLARAGEVRVPKPVLVGEQFLMMEWLDFAESSKYQVVSERKLGKQLARLHRRISGVCGLEQDNYIGLLPQNNDLTESWVEFYWESRIFPQIEIMRKKVVSDESRVATLEDKLYKLKDKLSELIPSKVEASLLHGDLWGGNWGVLESGEPVVYDPAVYVGHREMDLAMTELFGGFGREFYEVYDGEWKRDAGYGERRELYQLYPLMVHMNLFGGSYFGRVEAIVEGYL